MDLVIAIEEAVLSLLEQDYFKTTEYLVEELRVEYTLEHQRIRKEYTEKYQLSGCGVHQSPVTAVNHALNSLKKKGLVEKKTENGTGMWRLAKK
ncbi:MAG: hypothetical protein PHT78_04010 [Desulfitobacteriaceae bacterium]|nr:hypothetical protein [Desulfitobacteriaceae bacterium]